MAFPTFRRLRRLWPAPGTVREKTLARALAALLVLLCINAKVMQHYSFELHTFDTTIYANLVWNSAFGEFYWSSVLQKMHLGEHFSPVVLLFVPLYWIAPSPLWLLGAQGLAVGIFYVLLIPLARRILSPDLFASRGVLAFLVLLAAAGNPMNSALMFEFHPSTLTVPFIAGALIALHDRKSALFWACFAVICLCKENGTLAGVSLGLYAALVLRRWRMGLLVIGVSAGVAGLVFNVVMPTFQDEGWAHLGRFDPLALPLKKLEYLGFLLVASAALPLFAWRATVPLLPLIGLNLAVSYSRQLDLEYHYDDMSGVFLIVAAMHGANRVLPWLRHRVKGWSPGVLLAVLMLNLAVVDRATPVGQLFHFPRPEERALYDLLAPYRSDSGTGIMAFDVMTPTLMNRERISKLPTAEMAVAMPPGDLVLSSPIWRPRGHKVMSEVLNAEPRMERIEQKPLLTVWRRRAE